MCSPWKGWVCPHGSDGCALIGTPRSFQSPFRLLGAESLQHIPLLCSLPVAFQELCPYGHGAIPGPGDTREGEAAWRDEEKFGLGGCCLESTRPGLLESREGSWGGHGTGHPPNPDCPAGVHPSSLEREHLKLQGWPEHPVSVLRGQGCLWLCEASFSIPRRERVLGEPGRVHQRGLHQH